jgi:hypothetical protein
MNLPEQTIKTDEQMLTFGLAVLLLFETAFIAAIMLIVGASLLMTAGMVALVNAILVFTLLVITRWMWVPWQRRYPPLPIKDDAVTRTWQSFVFGYLGGFNHCLSLTADSDHLHLHPFLPLKWFGAQRISLPWDRMTHIKPSLLGTMSARIDGRRINGPAWAMKLAADENDLS